MLVIRLLGKTKIEYAGENLESKLGTKAIAMIYLLIANKGRYVPKDKLMLYLWPESSQEAARYNLRYNLWNLKKMLPEVDGQTLILSDKDSCTLNGDYPMACDLLTIKELKEEETGLEELLYAKELFCGDIMEGWYLKNCSDFNELILLDRMTCENRHMEILAELARRYEMAGEREKALEILREQAVIEPENETLALHIMELYADSGNRVAAINYYRSFEAGLWNSLKIAPDKRLTDFCQSLRAAKGLPQSREGQSGYAASEASCSPDPDSTPDAAGVSEEGVLRLRGISVKNVEYSLLSDLVTKALRHADSEWLLDMGPAQAAALGQLHGGFWDAYEKACGVQLPAITLEQPFMEVRIVESFCALIELLSQRRPVVIEVKNREKADASSLSVIEYLEKLEIGRITVR